MGDKQALLMFKELWMLVNNDKPCPNDYNKESKLKWQKCAQKAAGELFPSVELDQKISFSWYTQQPNLHIEHPTQHTHDQEAMSVIQCL